MGVRIKSTSLRAEDQYVHTRDPPVIIVARARASRSIDGARERRCASSFSPSWFGAAALIRFLGHRSSSP